MNSKLEIRLINYFVLIAFAAVLIGIEFYFEMDIAYGQQIFSGITVDQSSQEMTNPLEDLRNKILVMFMILSIVVAIVLTMFVKNIAIPLCNMAVVAKQINEGDLSKTVKIDVHDEIGEVGIAINELASNLQEVASFTSITANETLQGLKKIQGLVTDNPEFTEALEQIEKNLLSMSSFVNSFNLLDTELSNA